MNRPLILIVSAVIIVTTALSSLFTVDQRQQALVLQFGEPKFVVSDPGLHVKLPFIQNVVYLDKRILDLDAPAEEVIAADQKRLVVDSFARFRISNPLRFYQTVGTVAAVSSRLSSIVNSALRRVLGSQKFEVVLTGKRVQMMHQVSKLVNAEARAFGIDVVDVRIRRADLPAANSKAIYRRMQTEREREAKEFRAQGAEAAQRVRADADRQRSVIIADAKRESDITRGEGDAQAIKVFANAYRKDPSFFSFYRSMRAYRETFTDHAFPTSMVLSPNSEFLRYLNDDAGKPQGGAPK